MDDFTLVIIIVGGTLLLLAIIFTFVATMVKRNPNLGFGGGSFERLANDLKQENAKILAELAEIRKILKEVE